MKKKKQAQKRKQKIIHNIGIVLGGLVVAIGIHFFMIDETDISHLKTSVRDISSSSANQQERSDLYFEKLNDNLVVLKSSKTINNIKRMSFSVTYNPEDIDIQSIVPTNSKTKILNLSNIPGISTTILEWTKPENIIPGNAIVELDIQKLSEKTSPLNIVVDTIEFSDTANDTYSPTTSGTIL